MTTYMRAGGIAWKGIVMIAPPNQGSTVASQLSGLPGIGKLFQYAQLGFSSACHNQSTKDSLFQGFLHWSGALITCVSGQDSVWKCWC